MTSHIRILVHNLNELELCLQHFQLEIHEPPTHIQILLIFEMLPVASLILALIVLGSPTKIRKNRRYVD